MRFISRGHRASAPAADVHRYGSEADGSRNTIHGSTRLDIEVDELGRPVAVWFRCLNLPFRVWYLESGPAEHINPENMQLLNIEYKEV